MKKRKTTGKLLFITLIKSVVRLDLAMTDQNLNYLEFFLFLLHLKDWLGSPEPSSYYHFVMFFCDLYSLRSLQVQYDSSNSRHHICIPAGRKERKGKQLCFPFRDKTGICVYDF